MNWNRYRVLLALPQGLDSSAVVIAADRAGGLGILDGTRQGLRDRAIRRMRRIQGPVLCRSDRARTGLSGWLEQAGENLVAVDLHQFRDDHAAQSCMHSGEVHGPCRLVRGHVGGRGRGGARGRGRRPDRRGARGRGPGRSGFRVHLAPGDPRADGSSGLGPRGDRPAGRLPAAWPRVRPGWFSTGPCCWPASLPWRRKPASGSAPGTAASRS